MTAARSMSHAPSHDRLSRTKPSKVAIARRKSAWNAGMRSGRLSNQFSPGAGSSAARRGTPRRSRRIGHRSLSVHSISIAVRRRRRRPRAARSRGGRPSSSPPASTSAWLPGPPCTRPRDPSGASAATARANGPPPEVPIGTTASSPSWSASSSASAAAEVRPGGLVVEAPYPGRVGAMRRTPFGRAASATTPPVPRSRGAVEEQDRLPAGSPRSAYSRSARRAVSRS